MSAENVAELFFCQDCEDTNRSPIVALDRRLRCETCGSDSVVPLERLLAGQRLPVEKKKALFLIGRMV